MKYIQAHIVSKNPKNGKYIFLALKRAENLHFFPNLWQTVTGTIEKNESAVTAAIREVKEETGLRLINMWNIPYVAKFYFPDFDKISMSPVFGFEVEYSDRVNISSEHSDSIWLELEEFINKMILPSHKEGTEYFSNYILKNKSNQSLFLLRSFE